MSLVNNFQMLATYNQRINQQLLMCCQGLSEEELTQETHSFFPNVISYFNHILFGDLLMLRRLAANNIALLSLTNFDHIPEPKSPTDIYYQNIADITKLRVQVDVIITQFCCNLTDAECATFITYQTTEGENINKKVADITQHLFNHQTHHRGQLTCVLSQLGVDYACMDLPVIVPEGSLN